MRKNAQEFLKANNHVTRSKTQAFTSLLRSSRVPVSYLWKVDWFLASAEYVQRIHWQTTALFFSPRSKTSSIDGPLNQTYLSPLLLVKAYHYSRDLLQLKLKCRLSERSQFSYHVDSPKFGSGFQYALNPCGNKAYSDQSLLPLEVLLEVMSVNEKAHFNIVTSCDAVRHELKLLSSRNTQTAVC